MKIFITRQQRLIQNQIIVKKRIALLQQNYRIVLSKAQTKSEISNVNNYSKIIETHRNDCFYKADRV